MSLCMTRLARLVAMLGVLQIEELDDSSSEIKLWPPI